LSNSFLLPEDKPRRAQRMPFLLRGDIKNSFVYGVIF
jgi:hypothetical protein